MLVETLARKLKKIRINIDKVPFSPNLAQIKEILKRIHFADIANEEQNTNNMGDAYYQIKSYGGGKYFEDLTLDYLIQPNKLGIVYGLFEEKKDKNGNKRVTFNRYPSNNYVRFIADVLSDRVIYSSERGMFLKVDDEKFTPLDQTAFELDYGVKPQHRIDDFLEVFINYFEDVDQNYQHPFSIQPYSFKGIDFIFNCETAEFESIKNTEKKQLFFDVFQVKKEDLDLETPRDYINMINDDNNSLHNMKLIHAYALYNKLDLIHPEKFFILKDDGRTGKGLFTKTFQHIFKITNVNLDVLMTGHSFDAQNEWLNFAHADIALANETGEISSSKMKPLRKIATGETVKGRSIGNNNVLIELDAVLILDTNERVDIGDLTANQSRTVFIQPKSRSDMKEEDRINLFRPYWMKIAPDNRNAKEEMSLSFLIYSLRYLKEHDFNFSFSNVSIKNIYSANDLTDTQKLMLIAIDRQSFVLASDDDLNQVIASDYQSLRTKEAQQAMDDIGVKLNVQKWVDAKNQKVHTIGDSEKFNYCIQLLYNSIENAG